MYIWIAVLGRDRAGLHVMVMKEIYSGVPWSWWPVVVDESFDTSFSCNCVLYELNVYTYLFVMSFATSCNLYTNDPFHSL